jgi:hypothetical protein
MRGRTSYPRLLQQMNPRFIILKWGQNDNPWNGTILSHPGRKMSLSVGNVIIGIFWNYEGVILVVAILRGETVISNTYIRKLTELGKHFG